MSVQDEILVVDDSLITLNLLTDILSAEGFQVRSVDTGELALCSVASEPPNLVLLDVNMPDMDGFKVCQRLKAREESREIPVIFLSGNMSIEEKVTGFGLGAVDFISKPIQREELLARVRTHLELGRLRASLEAQVTERMGRIIQAMALTVETRNPYTAGHQRRVANLARSIGQEMGLTKDQIEAIHLAGTVHDLGMISLPAEILSKPTRLSALEFSLIKIHPQTSYDILKDIDFPWPIARIVSQHHERINGSGYPFGLKGQEILLGAKVLMVADVVEAISSHRPYRAGYGIDMALDDIFDNRGVLFDPEVVDACLRLYKEKGFQWE